MCKNTGIYTAVLLCKFRFQFLDIQFDLTWVKSYYRPQRSCGKVMFSQASVSHSVHKGEGRCMADTPLGRPPRGSVTLGKHFPPQADPLGRHPPGRHPPAQCMLEYRPPPQRPLQRTVRILLKCILVSRKIIFCEIEPPQLFFTALIYCSFVLSVKHKTVCTTYSLIYGVHLRLCKTHSKNKTLLLIEGDR